jgi:hypothetical protein
MLARQPGPYENVARKWLALAERRKVHVFELRDSGRWRHYYTWEQLLDAVREAVNSRDEWARLAGFGNDERGPDIGASPPALMDSVAADR